MRADLIVFYSAVLSLPAIAFAFPQTREPNAVEQWDYAVVRELLPNSSRLLGVTNRVTVSKTLGKFGQNSLLGDQSTRSEASSSSVPSTGAYEIWLVSPGRTSGYWYFPKEFSVMPIGSATIRRISAEDNQALKRAIRSVRPIAAGPATRFDLTQSGSYPSPPFSLFHQCKRSHIVAVGQVVGILRQGYTPTNNTNDQSQHTVVMFAVENYLKSVISSPPAVIKIWNYGAQLPWGQGKVGVHADDDPILRVGSRYLVFLELRAYGPFGERHRQIGYFQATVNGKTGFSGDLDEFRAVTNWNAKVRLEGGRALAAAAEGGPQHWRFREGPQIIDVSEAEAISAVRSEVAKAAAPR